jgi:hypothetical protein
MSEIEKLDANSRQEIAKIIYNLQQRFDSLSREMDFFKGALDRLLEFYIKETSHERD